MFKLLARLVRATLTVAMVLLLAYVFAMAAFTTGVVDEEAVGIEGDQIGVPEPVSDWPITWELPLDDTDRIDRNLEPDPSVEDVDGDPIEDSPGTTEVEAESAPITSDAVEDQIHEQINEIRVAENLSQVDHHDGIASVSRTYSHDMAERGYFSHVSPEGDTPGDRLAEWYPSDCRAVGENLAVVGTTGASDAEDVATRIVDGWMDSPGHRDNVLTPAWDSQGIGVYIDDSGRAYATQKFCDDR